MNATLILNDEVEKCTVNLALRQFARERAELALANIRAGNCAKGRELTTESQTATAIADRLD
jgi:hypothetical protein